MNVFVKPYIILYTRSAPFWFGHNVYIDAVR